MPDAHQIIRSMTLVYKLVLTGKKRLSHDLGQSRAHNHHNSGVTVHALPVELPSPWKQGSGELGECLRAWYIVVQLIEQSHPNCDGRGFNSHLNLEIFFSESQD